MFEEVPRSRRGLAGWSTRRIVLGPFAIGGGVLLAAVGGSVAVAATVFTATTMVTSDVPPRQLQQPVTVVSAGHRGHPGLSATASRGTATRAPSSAGGSTAPVQLPSGPLTVAERQSAGSATLPTPATTAAGSGLAASISSAPTGAGSASTTPSATPTASPSGPAGNAVVYVNGYDQASHRVLFEFATVSAEPDGGDQYTVSSPQQFSSSIADDLTITSGGQLCPPAGSSCTLAELIAGAQAGFYAEVAIDAGAALHSVLELDASVAPQSSSSGSPGASPARSGIAQPTASPTGSPAG